MHFRKFPWQVLFTWLLATFFLIGAIGNVFVPEPIAADYARWGYPTWFHYVTGGLEFATAVLLVLRPWRFWGALLGAAVMVAASATLLWHGEYAHALAPLTVLTLAAAVGRINRLGAARNGQALMARDADGA